MGTTKFSRTSERAGIDGLLGEIARGAAERDSTRTHPSDQVRALFATGLGAARVPSAQGGLGLTLVELMEVVEDLAAADSNIAHAVRNHFIVVERILHAPTGSPLTRYLSDVLSGRVFGTAFTELGSAVAGVSDYDTTLTRTADGHWLLEGTKFYSTGNLFADLLVVAAAKDGDTGPHAVVIPTDREGVAILDDWDGIGQRLTGSGTTVFTAVAVTDGEVIPSEHFGLDNAHYDATLAQLYLTVTIAGAIRSGLADVVDLVRRRGRNFYHGLAPEPRHDPAVQQIVGQIASNAFALSAAAGRAAQSLDRAWVAAEHGTPNKSLFLDASLDAARAKVFADGLSSTTASMLFDVGGGSTVRAQHNLDRHWRNVRTLSAHNPAAYKCRILGDYALNDVEPPQGSFF
jgi:alkylation response protein AidB-like acyl-CoA dehydrogenase